MQRGNGCFSDASFENKQDVLFKLGITLASCAYQVNVKRNGVMGVIVMHHLKTNNASYLNWEQIETNRGVCFNMKVNQ